MEKARTTLLESGLAKVFWVDAVLYSAYVTNRSSSAGREVTAAELWFGHKPNVSNMRVFGCSAFNYVPKELRRKLDNISIKMVMIGYSPSGYYKLYDPVNNKVVHARNVRFDEREKNKCVYLPIEDEQDMNEDENVKEKEDKESVERVNMEDEEKFYESEQLNEEGEWEVERKEEAIAKQIETRPKREIRKPKWHGDYVLDFDDNNDEALFALFTNEDAPCCYEDIESRDAKKDWKKAVEEEFKVIEENETWKVVPKPEKEKILDTKWIFTKKSVGETEICKARLVVKGYQQKDQLGDIHQYVSYKH